MYLTCITISQSTIITSPIGFNIGLTNVNTRLKQRCINVVPTLCNVVSKLCNVASTLFERRALTLYQHCATLKIRRRILFHFQRRFNVISTLVHNVDPTLKCRLFMRHFFETKSNLRCCWTLPSRKWPFQIVKYVKKIFFRMSLAWTAKRLFTYWKDILKFTQSAIGQSSRNIAYNRKLL